MHFLLFLSIFCCAGLAYGQAQLDLFTREKLKNLSPEKTTLDLFVRGFPDSVKQAVERHNGIFKFSYDHYSSVVIPLQKLDAFLKEPAVRYVENGEMPLIPLMDTAKIVNCVHPVHAGLSPLDTAYNGEGVIIGIIDFGIDLNNEDFKKPNGETRIRYLWDQRLTGSNAPIPYNYGVECSAFDINGGSCPHAEPIGSNPGHGTTVAGIAAGNSRSCTLDHAGMAPGADLIVVSFHFGRPFLSTFLDAVDYIFKKADAMGKPCVINASLGAYWGSHDGRDATARMIDAILEASPGRVLVCAAGNSQGKPPYHLGYEVSADTTFTWFKYHAAFNRVWYELWADTADFNQVWFAFGEDDPDTWQHIARTRFYNVKADYDLSASSSASLNFSIGDFGNFRASVNTTLILNEGRYNLQVIITGLQDATNYFSFITTGSGRFDLWSSTDAELNINTSDMVYQNLPPDSVRPDILYYKAPDKEKLIVTSYACSDKVITVGNFENRKTYYDVDSVLRVNSATPGRIGGSSSHGPTRDGRIKPDITATGNFSLGTAHAQQIALSLANDRSKLALCGKHFRNGGTSMASPVVAGIAALYLQKYPHATYRQVKDALLLSARVDSFTGAVPNNIYGYGKVSACDALLLAPLRGCTDSTAFNYNPQATLDDGSCVPYIYGCTNAAALNYDSLANTDDGSCIIPGCTDSFAVNYDSTATVNDGSCLYTGLPDEPVSLQPVVAFYPGVFRNQTSILYDLRGSQKKYTLVILNIMGQQTDVVYLPEKRGILTYQPQFLNPGVYFYGLSDGMHISVAGKFAVCR
ncbi:MAG: hypothetical protein KatS3mg031_2146 [Chitinophagales bacterium]|nr:MAG: hypothetical protein KatS3mg031_2146 [Chitinophagales bacterium]